MITPQLTEQYGQVERVSVVLEILRARACAKTGVTSNPKIRAAVPPAPNLKSSRRVKVMTTSTRIPKIVTPFQYVVHRTMSLFWPDMSSCNFSDRHRKHSSHGHPPSEGLCER